MNLRPSILKVLVYFDIFSYPVTIQEIRFFLNVDASQEDVSIALEHLTEERLVFRAEKFYSLRDDPALIVRRVKGNRKATEMLGVAGRISRKLFQFPFVRGIGISGSLSKDYADDNSDIDYFIVVKKDRLWITRTLLHLYKKCSYLTGRQHWYCMNYFIDEEALEIYEKNIFTATELITLKAVCGNGHMADFFEANDWATGFLPQYKAIQKETTYGGQNSKIKECAEWLLDNKLGNQLDDLLRTWTTKRWRQKELQGKQNEKGIPLSLKADKHYCRPNPAGLQQKIMYRYHESLRSYEIRWELDPFFAG